MLDLFERPQTRRDFFRTAAVLGGGLFLGGCEPELSCERDQWYARKRKDLIETLVDVEPGESTIKRVILNSADKLARAIQPDYMPFPDISRTPEPAKKREEKITMGVLDIYTVDAGGIGVFDTFMTDFLTASCMANLSLGENFCLIERYRIATLLKEYDTRRSIEDFDPQDAIKRGFIKGVNAVLTGRIYPSNSVRDKEGNIRYHGSVQVITRLIDVTRGDIIANAVESLPRNEVLNDWLTRQVAQRY